MATVVRKDTLAAWQGERVGQLDLAPPNCGLLWSDAELAACGLGRPIPFAVPAGKLVTAMAYALDGNGNVVEAPTLGDVPPPPTAADIDAANVSAVIANPRMGKVLFALVNAIRALQAKQPITADQLQAWVASL